MMNFRNRTKDIERIISTPINYLCLFIAVIMPSVLSVASYCYLDGVFKILLTGAFISVIFLVFIFLFLERKRSLKIKAIIIYAIENDEAVIIENVSDNFVEISVNGVLHTSRLLRKKLHELDELQLIQFRPDSLK